MPIDSRWSPDINNILVVTCSLRTFDATADEQLAQFLGNEALRLERTALLLARARALLRDERILSPADAVLRRAVGSARHKACEFLTENKVMHLSTSMQDRLDTLLIVDDDNSRSHLHHIKANPSEP